MIVLKRYKHAVYLPNMLVSSVRAQLPQRGGI
jgi:hypothetical protein